MKKTANALTKALYLSLVLLVVFMTSCKKDEVKQNPPTGGGNNGGNGGVTVAKINLSMVPSGTNPERGDTAFFTEIRQISISTQDADSAKVKEGEAQVTSALSGTFNTSAVVAPLSYTGTAFGKGGNGYDTQNIPVFSQRKSNLCWDKKWENDVWDYGWIPDSNYALTPASWLPMNHDQFVLSYRTDNKVEVFSNGISLGLRDYYLQSNETTLWVEAGNLWYIQSITSNLQVLLQIKKNPSGGYIMYRRTLKKV